MNISNEDFSTKIEQFLCETGLSPSTFGKMTRNDPRFVFRVRNGMEVKESGKIRIFEFMENYKKSDEVCKEKKK